MSSRCQGKQSVLLILAFAAVVLLYLPLLNAVSAKDAWTFADTHPAFHPQPWMCGSDPGAQLIKHEYENWHCTYPAAATAEWGLAFIGFHRQLILDYDIWRLSLSGDRVEIWDFGPGAIIPGDDETTSTPYTHCPEYPVSFRPAGAMCTGCMVLPTSLNSVNIGAFPTLGHAGAELHSSGWLNSFFTNAGAPGGDCNEIASTATATRDPIFYMGLKKVNDVARTWQRKKAADIVVVLDRSSSMVLDCSGTFCDGPPPPSETACRINAAKNAAMMLADLLEDSFGPGGGHRIGLVSFSDAATIDVDLVNVTNVFTDNDIDDTPFEVAIANMEPCGWTSIGAGLLSAMQVLAGGTNSHKAILLLTDGMENVEPFIADVEYLLGATQLCAIGIGEGSNEAALRDAVENHGGTFIAQEDINTSLVTLEKYFVDCFGQIFDEVINEDPELVFPANEVTSLPISVEILPLAGKLMLASSFRPPAGEPPTRGCRLGWIITTPAGNLVDLADPQVETGTGPQWGFVRVQLPYHGEHAGTWQARLVRNQRIFLHGFPTDAYADQAQGIELVREELHRLLPVGAENALYYEDGSITSESAYAAALQLEVAAGLIQNVTQAVDAADFASLLTQEWDLVVYARQMDPTPQPFDAALAASLCQETKALVTDLFVPVGYPNPIYGCLGITAQSANYETLAGNERLFADDLPLDQLAYPAPYLMLFPAAPTEPLIVQGFSVQGLPIVVGSGADCGDQNYFYTSHTAGIGRVEPANIRPRVLAGQPILATFQMTELNRPPGGWDQVNARVELSRPGSNPPAIYYLHDDGTHGDKVIGNNTWSNLIPDVALVPGPHKLRAMFDLTLGGQTVTREAEYSVIVEPEPEPGDCLRVVCYEQMDVASGWQLKLGPCLGNMCVENDAYDVVAIADRDWLCIEDEEGNVIPVGTQYEFTTPPIAGGQPTCLYDEGPLYLCVPGDAAEGEQVNVRFQVYSQNFPSLPAQICTSTYEVVEPAPTSVEQTPRQVTFALRDACPNPFNPRTEIGFSVPGAAGESHQVRLCVFDLRGRLVSILVDGRLQAGSHSVFWDGRDATGRMVPAGVYLYRFETAGHVAVAKVALIK